MFSREETSGWELTQGPVLSSWPFAAAAAFGAPSAPSAAHTRLLLATISIAIAIHTIAIYCYIFLYYVL